VQGGARDFVMPQSASLLVAVPSALVRKCTRTAFEATAAWPVKNGFGIRGINAMLWLGTRL
jgi:hypothetical protein